MVDAVEVAIVAAGRVAAAERGRARRIFIHRSMMATATAAVRSHPTTAASSSDAAASWVQSFVHIRRGTRLGVGICWRERREEGVWVK